MISEDSYWLKKHNIIKEQLRDALVKLRALDGAVKPSVVSRLKDKTDRMQVRLQKAVARAENRVKMARNEVTMREVDIHMLRARNDRLLSDIAKLQGELLHKDLLLKQRAKEVSVSKGKPGPDKKLVQILGRVKKHLTNPKTGVPYKGAEALCKEIDRALRP